MALERHNIINCLNIAINKTVGKYDFSIYRKQFLTDLIIRNSFLYPYQHKRGMLSLILNIQVLNFYNFYV